jgi:hypothetical protein
MKINNNKCEVQAWVFGLLFKLGISALHKTHIWYWLTIARNLNLNLEP